MPNNPTQDTYNPDGIGSEFEEHNFEDLNTGEVFRTENNSYSNIQYRKENDNEALSIVEGKLYSFNPRHAVYVKI